MFAGIIGFGGWLVAAGLLWLMATSAGQSASSLLAERTAVERVPDKQCQIRVGAPQIFADLCELERGAGDGDGVINIIHLGDSHIAADQFTKTIRNHMQRIWGDAGRGLVTPPGSFEGMYADGLKLSHSGGWRYLNSVRDTGAPFGLSGVTARSERPGAELVLESAVPTDFAQVIVAPSEHNEGAILVSSDAVQFVLPSPTEHPVSVTLPVGDNPSLRLQARTRAPVAISTAGFLRKGRGVRYYNYGLPSATGDTMNRWNSAQVRAEISNITPSMIVLSFGTNDGFNDYLDVESWYQRRRNLVRLLQDISPDATILIIAPPDGARRFASFAGTAGAPASEPNCFVLKPEQVRDYRQLVEAGDAALASWHAPPKLSQVRSKLRELAANTGSLFWDWSSVMGEHCGIHKWSTASPQLAWSDHVHLTRRGASISGDALSSWLLQEYEKWLVNETNNSSTEQVDHHG